MPTIRAKTREPAGIRRRRCPLTAGIPFARGTLRAPDQLQVCDADAQPLPSSASIMATWPDGSIKWALLDLQADIEPMARAQFDLHYGDAVTHVPPTTPLYWRGLDETLEISTGPLTVDLGSNGTQLFRSISLNGRQLLNPATTGEFTAHNAAGVLYTSRLSSTEIEEENPLRLVAKATGTLNADDDSTLLSWIARIYFYTHCEYFKVYFTFVHDQPASFVDLKSLRFTLPTSLAAPRHALLGARYGTFGQGTDAQPVDQPLSLVQWNIDRHTLLGKERSDHRTNAHGWLHLADAQNGITLKLCRPWQNYPKAYSVDGGTLHLDLYPDLAQFLRPTQEPGRHYTEIDPPAQVDHEVPLRIPQGMAKTHEFYLHCGPPLDQASQVDYLTLAFEQPPRLMLPSEHYADTEVWGPFQPFRDHFWPLELKLRQSCKKPNGLGLVNYGDEVRLTTSQGKTRTLTTENLAYELPRSILWESLRLQDPQIFATGEAAVFHLMDVDTVHYSSAYPEWVGGPYFEWSQNHHYKTTDQTNLSGPYTSHTWLGSLLDYYFLTGYRRAREVAEACADFCRKKAPYAWKSQLTEAARQQALDPKQNWGFSTRVAGWALNAMGTYYNAFPAERFLPAMEALVDLFEVWQDEEGRWRDQIGSFNRGATPFMDASVLQGLQQYYACSGDERARRILLDGARFLATHGRTIDGIFYYKESTISDTPHTSTGMLLGPLAFAFAETSDPLILDAGYRLFRWLVDHNHVSTYLLKDLFAFMPTLEQLGLLEDYRGVDVSTHLPPSSNT